MVETKKNFFNKTSKKGFKENKSIDMKNKAKDRYSKNASKKSTLGSFKFQPLDELPQELLSIDAPLSNFNL